MYNATRQLAYWLLHKLIGPGNVNIYEFEMPSTVDIFDGLLKYHPLLSSVFF